MKQISRLGGKKVFNTTEQFDEFKKGQIMAFERSRAVRQGIGRRSSILSGDGITAIDRTPNVGFEWAKTRFFTLMQDARHERWTFSLIHPSRGRPAQCLDYMMRWCTRCSDHNDIEYILSLDTDDCENYRDMIMGLFGLMNVRVAIGPNISVVQAVNCGAKLATGKVFVFVSDDFEPPELWDLKIQDAVMYSKKPWALFVDDDLQVPKPPKVQTMTIVSEAYYKQHGYMYHPSYISMFADNDYTKEAESSGAAIFAYHLVFRHNHPVAKRAQWDATYERENRSEAWETGKRVYEKRWGVI